MNEHSAGLFLAVGAADTQNNGETDGANDSMHFGFPGAPLEQLGVVMRSVASGLRFRMLAAAEQNLLVFLRDILDRLKGGVLM